MHQRSWTHFASWSSSLFETLKFITFIYPRHWIMSIRDIGFIESISTLSSCLQDQVLIFQTISGFLVLNYINEPMSRFACNYVRLVMRHLPAPLHHNSGVPGNIPEAHFNFRPCRSSVSDDTTTFRRNKVLHCNSMWWSWLVVGINLDPTELLENAYYTCVFLCFFCAMLIPPELPSVLFIKMNDLQLMIL